MTLYIQVASNLAQAPGTGTIEAMNAETDLLTITNDGAVSFGVPVWDLEQVSYSGICNNDARTMIDALANSVFAPNYGSGSQIVDIIILPVLGDFYLSNNASITTMAGCALPPQNSGLGGASLNPTNNCIVIYDTSLNNGAGYCMARAGTSAYDLPTRSPVILYHELSHASRFVNNTALAQGAGCTPCVAEETAAIIDENSFRSDLAARANVTPELRETTNSCAAICPPNTPIEEEGETECLIVSLVSGSRRSPEVLSLRRVRDNSLRRTEIGFAFFDTLHYDYYAFSPQACALLAGDAEMAALVLEGYVGPFLTMLRTLEACAFEGCDDAALGRLFLAAVGEQAQIERGLEATARVASAWGPGDGLAADLPPQLTGLLKERALPSEHVRWGLFEPIGIYRRVLALAAQCPDPATVGKMMREAIDAWVPALPIDDVWTSLSPAQLKSELEWLDRFLFKTDRSRAAFRRRLRQAYGDLPAIRDALDTGGAGAGGAP